MKDFKKDYTKILKIAVMLGADNTDENGYAYFGGKEVDLTASGEEDWQVAKHIINKLK